MDPKLHDFSDVSTSYLHAGSWNPSIFTSAVHFFHFIPFLASSCQPHFQTDCGSCPPLFHRQRHQSAKDQGVSDNCPDLLISSLGFFLVTQLPETAQDETEQSPEHRLYGDLASLEESFKQQ